MTQRKRLGLSIPISLYEIMKSEVAYTGQTLNALILQILWDWTKTNAQNETQKKE